MTARDDLLDAWQRWDDMPGESGRAGAMEEACRPIAFSLGMTMNVFRERLCMWRRTGRNRERALKATESGNVPEDIL